MLMEKVENALNAQFNAELFSSYLYLSMNAYFKSINLDGFANWMYQQAKEELMHAMKFYDFINQRGGLWKPGRGIRGGDATTDEARMQVSSYSARQFLRDVRRARKAA